MDGPLPASSIASVTSVPSDLQRIVLVIAIVKRTVRAVYVGALPVLPHAAAFCHDLAAPVVGGTSAIVGFHPTHRPTLRIEFASTVYKMTRLS
jgi:hypothetical protein